jgi:hypothetical protein
VTFHPQIPIGTIVTIEAPASRGDDGSVRIIPAIVMKQWADGSLQLFAFHFEGSFLMNSVPLADCKTMGNPSPPVTPDLRQKYAIRDAS